MDNKLSSNIKRGLKVTGSYVMALVIFIVLAFTVFAWGKESTPVVMPYFSAFIFLILMVSAYAEMRTVGLKENRPQYNINPPPYKGILYGIIGCVPILLVQVVLMIIRLPEEYGPEFQRRLLQLASGPLYWIAKLLGNTKPMYLVSLISVIIIAFAGYIAGHYNFSVMIWIKQKLGTKKMPKG